MKRTIRTALVKSLPVMAGYIVLGFGFGILAQKNGYGPLWALAMSTFIYAGSMQYMTVSLLTSGASLISTALTTLMVNARHLFYGISMIDKYKGAGKYKPYMIYALSDETYSLVCGDDFPEDVDYHLCCALISLFDQLYWIAGSLLGAMLGAVLPFDTTGIDFAMTALFVTVFVQQWLSTKNHIPAVTGVVAAVICLLVFGSDRFLIPSMVAITAVLTLGRKRIDRTEGEMTDA
ncbi:MAG: AzlC family ABC transporter permease [Clostridia bacterium]|nr:AzlC family ABC transporter permease [Clostridia bacterium]